MAKFKISKDSLIAASPVDNLARQIKAQIPNGDTVMKEVAKLPLSAATYLHGKKNKRSDNLWERYEMVALSHPYITDDKDEIVTLVLPACLMQVSRAKNIITSTVNGWEAGTIKEMFNSSDYEIRLSCIIATKNGLAFPKEELEKFIKFLNYPHTLLINSEYLKSFGIRHIVVTDYEMQQEQGVTNTQRINISAISDRSLDLDNVHGNIKK
jgi:hypothetical protein